MVELLVAMVIALLIAIAAAGALFVARQGFTNVDAAAQLRDNARFAQDTLQRVGVQVGFKSLQYAATQQSSNVDGISVSAPNVFGLNNASRTSASTWDAGTTRTANSAGYGSDILVLRYQTNTTSDNSTSSDGTMIDCMGIGSTAPPSSRDDGMVSILHVGVGSDGEPSLMCSRSATGTAPYDTQPLIQGVENFQVLYGVDGIAPGNTTVPIAASTADSVPERYLRADQITVNGNDPATYANWQRVRSIRIGMVLRSSVGTAIDKSSQTFYPLGAAKSAATAAIGSAFASTSDPGTTFTPTVDGRLRQVVTFTIHLRNYQGDL